MAGRTQGDYASGRPQARRRNNAPIRPPRRKATVVPDFVLTLAIAAWTMAVIFLAASFLDEDVTSGAAGRLLARLFAGALFVSGFFLLLLALALLRDDRWDSIHYVVPALVGIVIGGLEATFFLIPAALWLGLPLVLVIFVFYPFRRPLERVFHPARRASG